MTACLHHVILRRLLQPRCSTWGHECTTQQRQRGGRGRREGVTPQGTNKEGWVHECQPIRVKSPFTSKPVLHRFTPAAVLSTSCLLSTLTAFFFLLHTYQRHSFIKVNALRPPPRRSVYHQNASHDDVNTVRLNR